MNSVTFYLGLFPNPFPEIHSSLENQRPYDIVTAKISIIIVNGRGRLSWRFSESPIPRELSLFDLSANSLQKTHLQDYYYYLNQFRARSVGKNVFLGHLSKAISTDILILQLPEIEIPVGAIEKPVKIPKT